GEKNPSKESIFNLVKKTFEKTQAAQLTVSPEFTMCKCCKKMTNGMKYACDYCGAENSNGLYRTEQREISGSDWNLQNIEALAATRK
ncbi:MAG: hypothetical protein ACYTFY_05980, partial [Planctomycetota bacterium]